MPKISINNHFKFEKLSELISFIMEIHENEKMEFPDVSFSQLTLIFKDNKEESILFCELSDLLLQKNKNKAIITLQSQRCESMSLDRIKFLTIEPCNMDCVIDQISYYQVNPSLNGYGWDGTIILRMPADPLVALYVSAYARCRNLFMITTMVDASRSKEIFLTPGQRWL
ncbi:MAG: hypothetical protein K6T65_07945 [Peptococcaceae bacterium]|nr:hypothetical protein [Peptococcaceae bacterium]